MTFILPGCIVEQHEKQNAWVAESGEGIDS